VSENDSDMGLEHSAIQHLGEILQRISLEMMVVTGVTLNHLQGKLNLFQTKRTEVKRN
jgi:hypothetical protein